jgi:hypothetical protein
MLFDFPDIPDEIRRNPKPYVALARVAVVVLAGGLLDPPDESRKGPCEPSSRLDRAKAAAACYWYSISTAGVTPAH